MNPCESTFTYSDTGLLLFSAVTDRLIWLPTDLTRNHYITMACSMFIEPFQDFILLLKIFSKLIFFCISAVQLAGTMQVKSMLKKSPSHHLSAFFPGLFFKKNLSLTQGQSIQALCSLGIRLSNLNGPVYQQWLLRCSVCVIVSASLLMAASIFYLTWFPFQELLQRDVRQSSWLLINFLSI